MPNHIGLTGLLVKRMNNDSIAELQIILLQNSYKRQTEESSV